MPKSETTENQPEEKLDEVAPDPSLAAEAAELARTTDARQGTRGCLFIGLIYALFYFSGALLCWMLGSAAHRYTRNYDQLAQAGSLTEVRDALVGAFGPVSLTPSGLTDAVAPVTDTIRTLQNGAETVKDAAATLDKAAGQLQNSR